MKFFDCITCRAIDQGVSIAVEDTGEGIHNDKKAIIFDRFSQVDIKMTRASEGTGIGLALTRLQKIHITNYKHKSRRRNIVIVMEL